MLVSGLNCIFAHLFPIWIEFFLLLILIMPCIQMMGGFCAKAGLWSHGLDYGLVYYVWTACTYLLYNIYTDHQILCTEP